MNQLSQLLYWAGVFGNLGPVLAILGGLSIIGAIASLLTYADSPYREDTRKLSKSFLIIFSTISLLFLSGAIFSPSKETVYAIAASEVGEQVLKTPIVGKAEKALETWLDKQINTK